MIIDIASPYYGTNRIPQNPSNFVRIKKKSQQKKEKKRIPTNNNGRVIIYEESEAEIPPKNVTKLE